jgi:hypothetical protein
MSKRKIEAARGNHHSYNAYRVTSPAHEPKVIFAAGTWSAVGMLLQWRVTNGIGEAPFTLDPTWAASITGTGRQHIDEARASCRLARIGVCYRADLGWGIGGPKDERVEPVC